ncbi:MAG TPA: ParB/Srx family N-terminal domain-containing protein [Microlunatus sp.]|nr:ParB/Srx family N-terminal domain-containing protein [Microlunatus sp.]
MESAVLRMQRSAGNAAAADMIAGRGPASEPLSARSPVPAVPTVARAPLGAVIQGDVLPPPQTVSWGGDPFTISFARASAPEMLEVTIRYDGSFAVSGAADKTWKAEVRVGTQQLATRIRQQGTAFLLIDLLGDASTFLRISDRTDVDSMPGVVGRRHFLSASVTNGSSNPSINLTVLDPAAKTTPIPGQEPEDIAGTTPHAHTVLGDFSTWEALVDGDGDQKKELVVRMAPEKDSDTGAPRARVRLRELSGAEMLNVVGELKHNPGGFFAPMVTQVTDGDRPTKISLMMPKDTEFLSITPPKPGAPPAYGVTFAGADFVVAAKSPAGDITDWSAGGVAGGIVYNDISLGTYQDKFRLTLQARAGGTAILGLSPLFRDRSMGGVGIELPLQSVLRLQAIDVSPVSIGFDLDGDGKPDFQVFDTLTTPKDFGDQPERDRDHLIRLVGPGIGGEHSYSFQVRNGYPQSAEYASDVGKIVASNSRAVSGLNEQRKLDTYGKQLDSYEMSMMRVRHDCAAAGVISQAVYDAWSAFSADMISLRAQLSVGEPEPKLKQDATKHAQAFYAALSTETSAGQTSTWAPYTSSTKNEYTDTTTTHTVSMPDKTTGAGPQLAGNISGGQWEQAFVGYQTLVTGLDKWIVKKLKEAKGEHSDEAQQAEYLVSSRSQLAELEQYKPTRVLAVFHPDQQFSAESGYVPEIPLNLYYYRDGSTWYLKDLTNPQKPHHYKADVEDGQTTPPPSLFRELNDSDRMPEGVVHYEIPGHYASEVRVVSRLTFRKFLTYLGVGLALLGLALATAGTGAVAVAGSWALAGSAVAGGLSAALDLIDKQQHGDLTATTAIIDIAQIVASIAGVSALRSGAIAKGGLVAASEGNPLLGEAAVGAVRAQQIYLLSAGVRGAADVVTVVTMGIDAAGQLDAIENGPGDRASKDRAKALLLAQLAVTGGITALSIKGELPTLGGGRKLSLYTPKGETVPMALVEGMGAPGAIKFSQKDIGEFTGDKKMTIDELADSMRTGGWKGDPIHVIEMPDGSIVSLDNRRLWAARKAGLTDIPMWFHNPKEPFPAQWAQEGFELEKTVYRAKDGTLTTTKAKDTEVAYAKGATPVTFGEAALFRTANQGNIAGGGGKFPLWGRLELPRVRRKLTTAPMGSE